MTREDVIRWADAVGAYPPITEKDDYAFELADLIEFAKLVAAAEREACAKLCDNYDIRAKTSDGWIVLTEAQRVSSELATKIRARGEA